MKSLYTFAIDLPKIRARMYVSLLYGTIPNFEREAGKFQIV